MTAIAVGRNKDFDVQIGNLHTHYSVYFYGDIFNEFFRRNFENIH